MIGASIRVTASLLAACAVCAVCAVTTSGCAMFVSKDEYRDYRAVRVAPDDRTRLLALQRYAAKHRAGHWYDEIDRERSARDVEVFEAGKSSRAGLALYLAAFPDGAFIKQAHARLSAIDVIEARKAQERKAHASFLEQRAARDEELRRTWVERFASFWVKTLGELRGLGQGVEAVAGQNPDFSRAFGRAPRPRCTSDECVKLYESAYAVPVPGGTRIERAMRLALRLRMHEGKVVGAELLFPSFGFSRWREAQERRIVIDSDITDRQAAVQWAFDRLHAVIAKLNDDAKATPEPDYALAPIKPLRNATLGELTDTTAEDPSAPPERVSGAAPEPTLQQLVDPSQPLAADMELAPMRIDEQGRAQTTTALPGAPTVVAPAAGEEMVLEPVLVPPSGASGATGGTTVAPAPAPTAPAFAVAPARVESVRVGKLRIVLFSAAADDSGPGFDGILIEPL